MSAATTAAAARILPNGYRDLAKQAAIWLGFGLLYQLVRGLVGHDSRALAVGNAHHIVNLEHAVTGRLWELSAQHWVDGRGFLHTLVSWTYWNSEFTVVGIAILWVYLRRNEHFIGFRNAVLLANVLGLIGYGLYPTAPPRLLALGFVNQHRDGLVQLMANPYAAMPSLHAGDALLLGVVLFTLCRSWWAKAFWAVWPVWVCFSVMATGNHFWLDCVGGILVAVIALLVVYRSPARPVLAARPA